MTLKEFQLLKSNDQHTFLNAHKIFLKDCRNNKYLFKLFQAGEFFVEEVWQRPFNTFVKSTFFDSIQPLQRYVEVIDVSSVVSLYDAY